MRSRKVYEILSHGGQAHKTHSSFVCFVKQVQNNIRIGYTILCHPEFISRSHNFSNKNFAICHTALVAVSFEM